MGLRLREEESEEGHELVSEARPASADYGAARAGDHLMCPFQCDLCHFRNVYRSDPIQDSDGHALFFVTIRRANLDAFWARRPSTVGSNLQEMRRYLRGCKRLGADLPFIEDMARGPLPVKDTWAALPACTMLLRSLDEGRNSTTVQFNTVRRLRSCITNYERTTLGGTGPTTVAADKHKQRFTDAPTSSLFFERFVQGCHNRMGDVVVRDQALSVEVLGGLLNLLDTDYEAFRGETRFRVALLGAALTLGFSTALRGEEFRFCLLKATMDETLVSSRNPRKPHVMLALEGTFKGSGVAKQHRFVLALTSNSGLLRNKVWLGRLVACYLEREPTVLSGPLFRESLQAEGPITIAQLDVLFHEYLATLQVVSPELLSPQVEVDHTYSFRRSIRRGSTTHARNRNVPVDVIETNNRWKRLDRAGFREPSLSMVETYTDAVASLDLNIRYSQSL